jgi:hypothetical protein
MKLTKKTKLVFAVMLGLLSMSMSVVALPHGKAIGFGHFKGIGFGHGRGIGFGPQNNPARVSPKPTPPGHHFGWQKGEHNPHASPTP